MWNQLLYCNNIWLFVKDNFSVSSTPYLIFSILCNSQLSQDQCKGLSHVSCLSVFDCSNKWSKMCIHTLQNFINLLSKVLSKQLHVMYTFRGEDLLLALYAGCVCVKQMKTWRRWCKEQLFKRGIHSHAFKWNMCRIKWLT